MAHIYKLKKPITFVDKEYTELQLDFDSLTGQDLVDAQRQYLRLGLENELVTVHENTKEMQAYVAARAANCPPELIFSLSLKDFSEITRMVQVFIFGVDADER
ncbi:phage tail assembly protein [Paenibacillus thiaminolyticus]|uniref:phage tail assembly protein n=1 Tax=Paenibacillus thiaminolyticus TaxID=49283 RepID=UPI002543067F|nr:phage tail assembly protein [Paenibacillus thiaminolyticus]WII39195.1 phage tail assembly protein [Paenibacillus thiaminolyticus]